MLNVLRNYWYVLLAVSVGLAVLGFAILLPNLGLISLVLVDDSVALNDKLELLRALFGSIATNFTLLSAMMTIIISVLIGMNVSLMFYILRRQKSTLGGNSVMISALGTTSGLFGVGCAACGSLIFTGLVSTAGGVGLITLLPFRGQEFGVIGVVALSYATYFLVQKINRPVICEIT